MNYEEALNAVANAGAALVLDPSNGINGVAVGKKDGGSIAGEGDFCVTAFVKEKLTGDALGARGIAPFDAAFSAAGARPESGPGDVDVVEIGEDFAPQPGYAVPTPQRGLFGGNPPALNAQKPFTTLRCGIGITNPVASYPGGLSVGTAGFYLRDDKGDVFVVSNNHVIGESNAASAGDTIVQPGTLDLTSIELAFMPALADLDAIKIAELTALVTLQFFPGPGGAIPTNSVDAALARVDPALRATDDVDRLTFGGRIRGVAAPYTVDANGNLSGSARVYKVGRTTGYTEGVVTNVAAVTQVPYPGGNALFTGQIAVQPTPDNVGAFSDRGDSGSGVLNDEHELVGLLFAGSPGRTLVNPIDAVLSELRAAAGIPSLDLA